MNAEKQELLPNAYWVLPGKLMAGPYPGDLLPEELERKLAGLLNAGVNEFFDLTTPEDGLEPYQAGLPHDRRAGYRRWAIQDFSVPSQEEMREILDELDLLVDSGRTVYLHCWGGRGRTGTVVGCYLARHGLSGEKALARIAELRKGTPKGWMDSPETPEQRRMVLEWRD